MRVCPTGGHSAWLSLALDIAANVFKLNVFKIMEHGMNKLGRRSTLRLDLSGASIEVGTQVRAA